MTYTAFWFGGGNSIQVLFYFNIMKTNKTIHYRLGVSQTFPQTHIRAGEKTFFTDRILASLTIDTNMWKKLHTIRANYPLWVKRIKKVQAGEAVIELFYWAGKPYNSKQVVFATLDENSGCGLQIVKLYPDQTSQIWNDDNISKGDYPKYQTWDTLAKNDGLSIGDFRDWFRKYDLSEDMVIIHFTKFRY